jgi:GAF domain-containing protein
MNQRRHEYELRAAELRDLANKLATKARIQLQALAVGWDRMAAPRQGDIGAAQIADLGKTLSAATSMGEALKIVLDAAIALHGARFGNVQLYRGTDLSIACQSGFKEPFLRTFARVSVDDDSACGRAMREGRSIVIEDVETEAEYAPLRAVAAEAGFRAVQSTPMVTSGGIFVGMISTHFSQPHVPSKHDMVLIGIYARLLADAVQRF